MAPYLSQVKTALPLGVIDQEAGLKWIAAQHNFEEPRQLELLKRVSCRPSAISRRYSALPDFSSEGEQLFGKSEPMISERLKIYQKEVARALRLLDLLEDDPDHIIHVTCTGYVSPSPIQSYLSLHGKHRIQATNLYHMGCYAAIPATRTAAALAAPDHRVKVVHNELCTLHFQSEDKKAEQLVIQSLFADGHCSYLLGDRAATEPALF